MARLGVPVGGRVRKLRAGGDQSAPIPEEITSELGGSYIVVHRSMRAIAVTLHTPPYWFGEEIELEIFCRRRARLCVEPVPIADSCRWRRER